MNEGVTEECIKQGNPIECHTEYKNLVEHEFGDGKQPKITSEEVDVLNYRIAYDFIHDNPSVEFYTLRTFLEIAQRVNKI